MGRREEGGHFYLVTKESHTVVLFSALGRVGAVFTRGTEVAVATTHLGPGIQMCCIQGHSKMMRQTLGSPVLAPTAGENTAPGVGRGVEEG